MRERYYVVQIEAKRPHDENFATKYLAYDQQSGGYPWFPDNFTSAHFFRNVDDARAEIKRWKEEKPTVFNSGPTEAFRQICLPGTLRHLGEGGKDGDYQFRIRIMELKGNSLAEFSISAVSDLEVHATQYSNEPNKHPYSSWKETLR